MNQLRNLRVKVFGGKGFVGRHLIKYLFKHECIIKVPTRNPIKGYFLQPLGDVGQINLIKFDLSDNKKLKNLIEDSDIIINLIGVLFEKKRNDFVEVHYNFVKRLVDNIKLNKDRKSTRLNSSHKPISYAVFCLKKKKTKKIHKPKDLCK